MRILFVSPLGFPINAQTKYAGIEQLVWNYSQELSKNNDVSVLGHADSIFPDKVQLLPYKPQEGFDAEIGQYQQYQSVLRQFDVIHDFSHYHLASRFNPNLPSLNLFWHAPNEFQYPKSPYNIIGLSRWACREFRKAYHQEAKYQQSIALDTDLYKIGVRHREDRFLTIGRMAKEKGNLKAIEYCNKLNVPLDVCGGDSDPVYKEEILKLCDGNRIKYRGEVSLEEKIQLMQSCKALIYATDRPEVTSHKLQEAMLCGALVVVPAIGALPEIIRHAVNGYLCFTEFEFLKAMTEVDRLEPMLEYKKLKETYSIENVIKDYIPLFERVANGERW